jgi:hypothetical protein
MSVKGYMVLFSDYSSILDDNVKKLKYEIGRTYSAKDLGCDEFIFFSDMFSAYDFYGLDVNRHFVEVSSDGDIQYIENDSYRSFNLFRTNKIAIIREVSDKEIINSMNWCSGCGDILGSNDCGILNGGNYNVGNFNEGNNNFGYHNDGDMNVGSHNDGDCNFGHHNRGSHNVGDYNTGHWNKCDNGYGFFNTKSSTTLCAFNKPLNIDIYDTLSLIYRNSILDNIGLKAMNENFKNNIWIQTEDMTDIEKDEYTDYAIFGGYLKELDFNVACKNMWDNMSEEERNAVSSLPNFDPVIFKEITGINITETSQ